MQPKSLSFLAHGRIINSKHSSDFRVCQPSAGDTDWYKVQLHESADTFAACGAPLAAETLSATITMTPPAGMDYDLEVCPDATLTACGFSEQFGSTAEVFNFSWDGTCGSDDSRSLYIKVYPYPASASSSSGVYSLHVTFN